MPEFQFQQAALVLNCLAGVDAKGDPVYKKMTYRHVAEHAAAEQLHNIALAIDGLTSNSVVNVEKSEKQIII
ncbi:MAG: DUF1659 domain-containing protein [Lysinibacillus sp.]